MKVVNELITYFDRRGKLSGRQLRDMLDTGRVASDAPPNMHGLGEVPGTVYYFRVTGALEGQVWGTGTYTRDSALGAAAVHAGLLKPGETRVLRLTIVAPLEKYEGTTRNGVTTIDYGRFPAWQLSAI